METLLYIVAKGLVVCLQLLPLRWVARLGRFGGALAYLADARHRRVAKFNLAMCFPEKSPQAIRALAQENFRRIGENFACAVKTASMSFDQVRKHVDFSGPPWLMHPMAGPSPRGVVAAIGHFGNFELYARFSQFVPAYKSATTYRGLRQRGLNRLLQSMRERSGCLYFERRFDAGALKFFMHQPGVILGLLADQHGGANGLRLPFLGHDCSTSAAPAVFALRYHCALVTAVCYRTGLARWRIEASEEIPTHADGQARSTEVIMRDVNQAFEVAVRTDPANWFWVHNRWKLIVGRHPVAGASQTPGSSAADPP